MKYLISGAFAVICFLVVGFMDLQVARTSWLAYRSAAWPVTEGTIVRNALISRGKSTSIDLSYSFDVNGQNFTGTKYDLGPAFLPKQKWQRVHAELPVGTTVDVSYDPTAPSSAVLRPGLGPEVVPIVISTIPFNVVAVFVGIVVWRTLTKHREFHADRDVMFDGLETKVRLNGYGRWLMFGLVLLITSFFSVFAVVVGLHSALKVPASWWLDTSILVGIIVFSAVIASRWGGHRFMILRDAEVSVPSTSTGREMVEVSLKDLKEISVREESRPNRRRRTTFYVVSLELKNAMIEIAEYGDRIDAEDLAEWLRIKGSG